jgi:hypothetical protein
MTYKDPISGKLITVRSVYIPTRTLLQGAPYYHHNTVLDTKHPVLSWHRLSGT